MGIMYIIGNLGSHIDNLAMNTLWHLILFIIYFTGLDVFFYVEWAICVMWWKMPSMIETEGSSSKRTDSLMQLLRYMHSGSLQAQMTVLWDSGSLSGIETTKNRRNKLKFMKIYEYCNRNNSSKNVHKFETIKNRHHQ